MALRAVARVNLAAVERNVARLRSELGERTALCAVVKADGYGHGAVPSARAALSGGAGWLAVATAAEAVELRRAGIDERILIMGAISAEELPLALEARADLVGWSQAFVDALVASDPDVPVAVHVKLDTGMGRLGTRDLGEALAVADAVLGAGDALELAGAMTHFATADEDAEFLAVQLAAFEPFIAEMRRRAPGLVVHAANSAATLRDSASHFDLVRCGIAIYGLDPMNKDASAWGLEPALELSSYVAAIKLAARGDSVGYGRRYTASEETWIATLPIGYADGIRRGLTNNCDVLVDGRRYPLVGTVSMDNIAIALGSEPVVEVGEEATLIGRSGELRQRAEELAHRLSTINYEIVCGISARVPRIYHRDGEPL